MRLLAGVLARVTQPPSSEALLKVSRCKPRQCSVYTGGFNLQVHHICKS